MSRHGGHLYYTYIRCCNLYICKVRKFFPSSEFRSRRAAFTLYYFLKFFTPIDDANLLFNGEISCSAWSADCCRLVRVRSCSDADNTTPFMFSDWKLNRTILGYWVIEMITSIVGLRNVIKDVIFNWNQVTGTFPGYVQLVFSRKPLVRMWLAPGMGSVYFGNIKTDFSFKVLTVVWYCHIWRKSDPSVLTLIKTWGGGLSWECGKRGVTFVQDRKMTQDNKWFRFSAVFIDCLQSHQQYTKESVLS